MFKQNEGKLDRTIRLIIGVVGLYFGLFVLSGAIKIIALIVGTAMLVTGSLGFCGLYTLLGINTCPVDLKTSVKSKNK